MLEMLKRFSLKGTLVVAKYRLQVYNDWGSVCVCVCVCVCVGGASSWVLQSSQEKMKTMLIQNFGGVKKVYRWRCASGRFLKEIVKGP